MDLTDTSELTLELHQEACWSEASLVLWSRPTGVCSVSGVPGRGIVSVLTCCGVLVTLA